MSTELILTLPPNVHGRSLATAKTMFEDSQVAAVRYNTGATTPKSPQVVLSELNELAQASGKAFYVDLKGKQLRVAQWTAHTYDKVKLNRPFEVELPAKIYFRGEGWVDIIAVDEDAQTIYLEPGQVRFALGEGQAVNIVSENLTIHGYLTSQDSLYIEAAVGLGIDKFMLSFVESGSDILDFYNVYHSFAGSAKPAELVFKIESQKGLEFVSQLQGAGLPENAHLMLARDDLALSLSDFGPDAMIATTKKLVAVDPQAIAASRIFAGLESPGVVTLDDVKDVYSLQKFGYRRFMLSDGISVKHFDAAMTAWRELTTMLAW